MACCFMIWRGFGVATTSSQHLLQVSLFSRDIFSGLLILFEMDSTLCLSWPAGVILLRSASPKFADWALLLADNGLWQFMLDYGLDNVLFLLMIPCVYGCLCNSFISQCLTQKLFGDVQKYILLKSLCVCDLRAGRPISSMEIFIFFSLAYWKAVRLRFEVPLIWNK